MDTRLDENEAELGVLVLAVALKVLADGNGLGLVLMEATRREARWWQVRVGLYLLDQHVQILGHLRCEACHLNHSVSLDHTEA